MSYRILTKNSVDNTNIDGARQNHFNAGMRSGVVKGALNECNVTSPASNQIVINTGELRISGHQIVIEETEQLQLTNTPQTATDYSIIAEISVNDSSVPTFRIFIQPQNSGLVQDNLFALLNGIGTYQIKLANFTQNTDGSIFNLERVADLISGITKEQIESAIDVASNALSQSNTALSKSNTAIDNSNTAISSSQSAVSAANTANTNANTALTQSNTALETANNALDRVVEGLGTKVSVGGTTQSTIDFDSNPQEQIDNKLSLSGGTMTGDIKLPAGKFVVDDKGYGLVGYYGEGSATFGNPNRGINLRGNTTRPLYNSSDVAMYSDLNKFSKTTTHYVTSNTSDLSALDIELGAKVHTRPYLIMAGSPNFYKSGGVSYLRVKYVSTGSGATYSGQFIEAISNQNANFVSVVATLPQVNTSFKIYIEVATDSGSGAGLSAYNSAYLTVVEL